MRNESFLPDVHLFFFQREEVGGGRSILQIVIYS